nr:MAG TPA: hypothetical protein [Caudoviricetes sp.]
MGESHSAINSSLRTMNQHNGPSKLCRPVTQLCHFGLS